MKLFQRIFFAAVLAGLAAGLAYGGAPAMARRPADPRRPRSSRTASRDAPPRHEHADDAEPQRRRRAHEHDADAWAPAGWHRAHRLHRAGRPAGRRRLCPAARAPSRCWPASPITAANGVLWGLAGFVAFQLAPAFGLPPELPGMPAADLVARQIWWWATALATGAGLLRASPDSATGPAIGVAAVLMLLPHIIGAPPPRRRAERRARPSRHRLRRRHAGRSARVLADCSGRCSASSTSASPAPPSPAPSGAHA